MSDLIRGKYNRVFNIYSIRAMHPKLMPIDAIIQELKEVTQ